MSRSLTSAQIIAQGEYLNSEFDPTVLTVSQLLGIFGFHNINYPSQYTKPKLVQLFNDEIKPRAGKFKKERLKRENSQASDDGITDGLTGRPISETAKPPPVRRSSRRISRAPTEEPVSTRVDPPKRRRSSAEPSLGGPSRRRTVKPSEPVVVEESEPEDIPVRKVSRNKKNVMDAGTRARRVSQTLRDEDRDSGWEDNNIFQSGAESSSPARPSPVRVRARRSPVAPRSRKSMSAPPEYAVLVPSKGKEKERSSRQSSVKPPSTSNFDPALPQAVVQESNAIRTRRSVPPQPIQVIDSRNVVEVPDRVDEEEEPASQEAQPELEPESPAEKVLEEPETEPISPVSAESEDQDFVEESNEGISEVQEDEVTAVSLRLAEGGELVPMQPQVQPTSWSTRVFFTLMTILSLYYAYQYKLESAPLGFCDAGKSTNGALDALLAHRVLVENCNLQNRSSLLPPPDPHSTTSNFVSPTAVIGGESTSQVATADEESCPPLPLLPFLEPKECTPCPAHATCSISTMTCETGYLIKPNSLLFFLPLPSSPSPATPNAQHSYTAPAHLDRKSLTAGSFGQAVHQVLSFALDGTPGFGPVALPPYCVEDPKRKRNIGTLGTAIEITLATERGRRLCDGVGFGEPITGQLEEAIKWGMEIDELKEGMRQKISPKFAELFEDTFNEAIQQLVQWRGVIMAETADGKRYLAHKTPQMDWTCAAKVKGRELWYRWRYQSFGLSIIIASIIAFRRRQAQRSIDNARVAGLVQIALELLRNQELAHHTDPITAPHAYLSSLQLRDLVLQDEHSVWTRRRLWEKVEKVVEGNANVRTNLEEVEGGDEMRVWKWVGSAGKTLPQAAPKHLLGSTPVEGGISPTEVQPQ